MRRQVSNPVGPYYRAAMRCRPAVVFLVLCAAGCSDTTVPVTPSAETISVTVELPPEWRGALLARADGRVLTGDGTEIATFAFEAAWDIPLPWAPAEATATGAATEVKVELPTPGTYTFELSDVGVSGSPCGTCGSGYAETSTVREVDDGSVVELPVGDPTWIS